MIALRADKVVNSVIGKAMYQFEIFTARTHSQMPRAIMVQSIRLKPIIFSIVGLDRSPSLVRNRHHT
jgi:hypothetical protein